MHSSTYIKNKHGDKLFVDTYIAGGNAANVIFCCTPVASVTEFEQCYKPLYRDGFNVFAIDFTGVGKSGGEMTHFSCNSINDDLHSLIQYIKGRWDTPIMLFGGTGTGGIIAQNFINQSDDIAAFAQYGVCIFGDVSPLKMPLWLAKPAKLFLGLCHRISPRKQIPFNPPAYHGYNAEKDDLVYQEQLLKNPDFFKVNISLVHMLLEIFTHRKKVEIKTPTLVFKTMYDRYFSKTYFDDYYNLLQCEKKIVEINDVHNSFYFYADFIAKEISEWFSLYC